MKIFNILKKIFGHTIIYFVYFLLIGEFILRLPFIRNRYIPFLNTPPLFKYDPLLKMVHVPLAKSNYEGEGKSFVQINSHGLRDIEYSLEKQNNTIRIAILGDSFTEAIQVPLEKTFCKQAEQHLKKCPFFQDKKVEIINFGVSSYGTIQEFLVLQKDVWDYSPNMVIIAMYTANDIMDNSPDFLTRHPRPYYEIKDNKLIQTSLRHFSAKQVKIQVKNIIHSHSNLLYLISSLRGQLAIKRRSQKEIPDLESGDVLELGENLGIYRPPTDQKWIHAWQLTEDFLLAIHRETQLHSASLLIMTLSNELQVFPYYNQVKDFMLRHHINDIFYPDHRISEFAKTNHIPILTLVPILQQFARSEKKCIHGFSNCIPCGGHWNELGHELAGKALAEKICAEASSYFHQN
ncbi:SGNH/GDSL hydrolase family protein [Pajaroellobacter abortibovis]|uniref:SGNH hydrolase-type esterase domain-containing protein n=1 Tax=Pajaroellobacter abortibovis TaxID=1882918 RepID=A0A1L6MX07_9BACT|nr:SGNH/GDSL hydrolase family protein [Pajaroellobacter abortibovis]APR99958.1 hypothetical protein BCY86_04120 [Pajaroellobacter abortibovis]